MTRGGVYLLLCLSARLPAEDLLAKQNVTGQRGGRLTVALRAEPKTLNPTVAMDVPSREVIARMNADLISINRQSPPVCASTLSTQRARSPSALYTGMTMSICGMRLAVLVEPLAHSARGPSEPTAEALQISDHALLRGKGRVLALALGLERGNLFSLQRHRFGA